MPETIELQPSPPDELGGIVVDVCAVIARLILLAPPERQKEVCALVLREINDIVEQVLDVNNIAGGPRGEPEVGSSRLLKKRGIWVRLSNNRIRTRLLLNRSCVSDSVFESMLLTDALRNGFSAAC